jgi:hypothetical protein
MLLGTKGVSLPLVVCNHLSTPVQADPKGQNVHLVYCLWNEMKTIHGVLNFGQQTWRRLLMRDVVSAWVTRVHVLYHPSNTELPGLT